MNESDEQTQRDMSDCNETLRELDSFLDDELSPEVREHIHGHLADCVDCFQAFDFYAELKAAIRRKCANDPMPPSLRVRIEACLQANAVGAQQFTLTESISYTAHDVQAPDTQPPDTQPADTQPPDVQPPDTASPISR